MMPDFKSGIISMSGMIFMAGIIFMSGNNFAILKSGMIFMISSLASIVGITV